jgi:hypothetical protein
MRMIAVLGLVALPLLAVGCGSSGPPAKNDLTAQGIHYDLPIREDPADPMHVANEFLKACTPTGVKWSNGKHTLDVDGSAVTLDGRKYGPVKAGDRVKLTADGVLYVNDFQRRPLRFAESAQYGYVFRIECPEGAEPSHSVVSSRDKDSKVTHLDLKIASGGHQLRVEDGKLTLNNADCGTVRLGDTVKLTAEGKVWVNDQPRGQ